MDRLKEGIVVADGIELGAHTTLADLEKIDLGVAVYRSHPHGYVEVIFNHPVSSDGVDFRVSMRIMRDEKHKVILLDPILKKKVHGAIDESIQAQEICEEWLKRNMDVPPTRDTDEGIFYDFPWGHVYSSAAEHINFGHLEGGILLIFGEDVD